MNILLQMRRSVVSPRVSVSPDEALQAQLLALCHFTGARCRSVVSAERIVLWISVA
jgi:hypothetical protein